MTRRGWQRGRLFDVSVLASLVLHAAAYFTIGLMPKRGPPPSPAPVYLEVTAPEPVPDAPKPPAEPEISEPTKVAQNPPVAVPADNPPAAHPEPEQPVAPVDLGGITLSNTDGWTIASGEPGPVGRRRGRRAHGSTALLSARTQPKASALKAQPLAPAADLSKRPTPPASLASRLRQLYPEEARRRGLRGQASLRVRIDADGQVRTTKLLAESAEGFGAACRAALMGSVWSSPVDRTGRAVATEVRYTCRFVVE